MAKILPVATATSSVKITASSKHPVLILEEYLTKKFEEDKDFDWKNTILPLGKEILVNETEYTGD